LELVVTDHFVQHHANYFQKSTNTLTIQLGQYNNYVEWIKT